MRLLYILLFSVTLFAGEWSINDFTIRGKQFTQSATGILQGNLNRIPSYQAPKGDELLLRRRLDMNNYGLYLGKAEAKAYTNLSRFTKPSGMSMDKLLKMKFYKAEVPTGYNDVADIYFQGEYIYVQNMERVFYKDVDSWKSLENAQLAKNEKFRVFYDITPADFSLFVDNGAAQSELVYGLHNFRFSAPGYSFLDTTLVLISDTTIQCALGVAQTEVKIVVKNSVNSMFLGGVEVLVNGVSYGTNPRSISLKSGEHTVTLKKEGFETFTTSLKVGTLPFEKEFQLSPKMVDKEFAAADRKGVFADISTNMGTITVKLEFEKTPITVANFIGLAEGTKKNTVKELGTPYYDGISFHRVSKLFVIQTGDPTGTGQGGPGYTFPDEFDESLKHTGPGILSMANAGSGTNGSQFFITHSTTPHLDGYHTVFGHVVSGMDVVNAIANVQTIEHTDKPVEPVVMNRVRIRRVGKKAKAFKGDQAHFESLLKEKEEKEAREAELFRAAMEAKVKEMYPTAKLSDVGQFYVVTHKKGSGRKPTKNTEVSVHYTGSVLESAFEFDSSIKRGTPFKFKLGTGYVIKGWELAVANMRKGEKQTIILPPELAYGARGAGSFIPPNAWLVFEVELLDF